MATRDTCKLLVPIANTTVSFLDDTCQETVLEFEQPLANIRKHVHIWNSQRLECLLHTRIELFGVACEWKPRMLGVAVNWEWAWVLP